MNILGSLRLEKIRTLSIGRKLHALIKESKEV